MKGTRNKGMRKTLTRFVVLFLVAAFVLAIPAFAYDRQESTTATGGTEVTVYTGLQDSNDQGNYLKDPAPKGIYLAYNRYQTAGSLVSNSNITSSSNFTKTITPDEKIVGGGVKGVSWNGTTNTLTLNNVKGTVITIEGPTVDPFSVNTYNDKLNPVIDLNAPNLTYYQQFDLFVRPGEDGGAPHTKDNSTMQDVVTVNIVGSNTFHNIVITGNVKVVFTGTGTLTVDVNDGQNWNYNDYVGDPNYDALSAPAGSAIASVPTIGQGGKLEGTVENEDTMPNGMVETITEKFKYELPEIAMKGVSVLAGGAIQNTAKAAVDYFAFTGETAPNDADRLVEEAPTDMTNTYALTYKGATYNMVYNSAKTEFYVTASVGMGPNARTNYYDVSADIVSWDPWMSYIGSAGAPAETVVIGSANAVVSSQKLTVDGKSANNTAYNIGGGNYYKLRDIAALLNGTPCQFSVDYDEATKTVFVKTGEAYTPIGGELTSLGDPASCVTSQWVLNVDGTVVSVGAFNIGGSNYFKLRDLGDAIGFIVDYEETSKTVVIRTDS